jgi:hypothetical protein
VRHVIFRPALVDSLNSDPSDHSRDIAINQTSSSEFFGSVKIVVSANRQSQVNNGTMTTISPEEIQSKFFDYVDQRQALYIERLGEAVA